MKIDKEILNLFTDKVVFEAVRKYQMSRQEKEGAFLLMALLRDKIYSLKNRRENA